MHRSSKFIVVLAMALMLGLSIVADAASRGTVKTVQLTSGKADTVTLDRAVADLLVANPAIADVGTLRSNRLYIVGKQIGDTNVLAFDEAGNQLADISVRVRADEQGLKDSMREFFPGENVEVKTVKDEIVLRGRVSNPSIANQVRDLASRFVGAEGKTVVDLMSVEGDQQVMLKVKVIEARRTALREYGFDVDYVSGDGGTGFESIAGTGLQSLSPFLSGQLFLDQNGNTRIGLQGLERDGLINVLAEPNLTAISGETAGFLAGGEFPVPVGRDQDGNITLEFKQFGVSLNFTPTVLSSERISLQLSTEVSTKSEEDGVTLVNTRVPGLSVRRAETTVQMGSGGTVMIAGLINSNTLDSMSGFPGVQDVPILGELFRSKSFARNETELIILVTPYLVKPYAQEEASQMPRTERAAVDSPAPVKMPAPVMAVDEVPARAARDEENLSRAFMKNLKSVYGSRVPASSGPDASYGYIVD